MHLLMIINLQAPRVTLRVAEFTSFLCRRCNSTMTLFSSVCMAQCKASRRMLGVGIFSGNAVSQLWWDRLRLCLSLTFWAVCILPMSFKKKKGRKRTALASLSRLSVQPTQACFSTRASNCVSVGRGHKCAMWIRPHRILHVLHVSAIKPERLGESQW